MSMKITTGPVVVIGLDGATFSVIDSLVEQGKLTHLASLMRNGVRGILRSTIPPKTPQAWSSFMTGKNPGKHGVFGFSRLLPKQYTLRYVNSLCIDGESLWHILSRHGKLVGVINVPMTYPPEQVNGFVIGGMFSPGVDSGFTFPLDLYDEIKAKIGEYIIDVSTLSFSSEGSFKENHERDMARMEAIRGEVARYLYTTRRPDFYMVVFSSTDRVGHAYWRYYDPAHPEYNPTDGEKYGKAIERIYAQVDEEIGKLLQIVGQEATVFVMSDHGMTGLYRVVYMTNWLVQHGFLHYRRQSVFSLPGLIKRVRNFAWRLMPFSQQRLMHLLMRMPESLKRKLLGNVTFSGIDWSRTVAFPVGYDGNLFINTVGERPQGIVEPGEHYQRICQAIKDALYELTDPATGEKLIERVYHKSEVYTGPHLDKAPDLIIVWKGFHTRNVIAFSDNLDSVVAPYDKNTPLPRRHSGFHNLDGVFIAKGPGLRSGIQIQGATLEDLAPTILYAMDLPIPQDMDGRVLLEIFEESFRNGREIKWESVPGGSELSRAGDYKEGEESKVAERLRGLGYLD